MKKNYFAFFAFLLCTAAFSQTEAVSKQSPDKSPNTTAQVISSPILNSVTPVERNPLPSIQKPSPAVFYIINDQPVDEQTYKNHQKQLLKK